MTRIEVDCKDEKKITPFLKRNLSLFLNKLFSACDGARTKDHVGLNRQDSLLLQPYKSIPYKDWDDKTTRFIYYSLFKYKKQLLLIHNFSYSQIQKTFD